MGGKTTTTNSSSNSTANTSSASQAVNYGATGGTTTGSNTSTSGASSAALPYINTALGDLNASRDASTGLLNSAMPNLADMVAKITSGLGQGNESLDQAMGYATSVMNGQGLDNPYMERALENASSRAENGALAAGSVRGLAGGSQLADLVARSIFDAQSPLLMNDWNNRMNMRITAAGMIPQLVQTESGLTTNQLNNLGSLVNLPYAATAPYANGIGSLVGNWLTNSGTSTSATDGWNYGQQYGLTNSTGTESATGTSTQKESGGLLGSLLGGLASLGSAAITKSDIRAKQDIARIGETNGGLPLYSFRYIGEPEWQTGVMAQEVAQMQPEALGPIMDGFLTVDYGRIQ